VTTDANGRNHTPAGVRTGGQYATQQRGEPEVRLDPADTITRPAHPLDDPTWARGERPLPHSGTQVAADGVDLSQEPHVQAVVDAVLDSDLSRVHSDRTARGTFDSWHKTALREAQEAAQTEPEKARHLRTFAAGLEHGMLAMLSNTSQVRDEYVVARVQRELGSPPIRSMFTRTRAEMVSKRTSKASRQEWADLVASLPDGPMRRGVLVAGAVMAGQDGSWGMRTDAAKVMGAPHIYPA